MSLCVAMQPAGAVHRHDRALVECGNQGRFHNRNQRNVNQPGIQKGRACVQTCYFIFWPQLTQNLYLGHARQSFRYSPPN